MLDCTLVAMFPLSPCPNPPHLPPFLPPPLVAWPLLSVLTINSIEEAVNFIRDRCVCERVHVCLGTGTLVCVCVLNCPKERSSYYQLSMPNNLIHSSHSPSPPLPSLPLPSPSLPFLPFREKPLALAVPVH